MSDNGPNLNKQIDAPVGDDAAWFRAPTARERRIAGWLFIGFGVFFGMLFILHAGWWFRWVVLALGIFSLVRGIGFFRFSQHHEDRPE